MISINNFTGTPFKSFMGGVDLYRLKFDNPNRQEVHSEIRSVLGNALYRMEDFDIGFTSVYVHRRLVEKRQTRVIDFGAFVVNETAEI